MYDWLAGSLILQEAGTKVTSVTGGAFTWGADGIIAANRELHTGILSTLQAS